MPKSKVNPLIVAMYADMREMRKAGAVRFWTSIEWWLDGATKYPEGSQGRKTATAQAARFLYGILDSRYTKVLRALEQ